MCLAVFKKCECGASTVQFHLRDNLFGPEIISRLFCPSCPGDIPFDPTSMLNDNSWLIEYDMVLARTAVARQKMIPEEQVCPDYLFDQGYCAWLETYPGEKEEIREAKEKILLLQKDDQQKYLREIIAWNVSRLKQLKADGWRKAQLA